MHDRTPRDIEFATRSLMLHPATIAIYAVRASAYVVLDAGNLTPWFNLWQRVLFGYSIAAFIFLATFIIIPRYLSYMIGRRFSFAFSVGLWLVGFKSIEAVLQFSLVVEGIAPALIAKYYFWHVALDLLAFAAFCMIFRREVPKLFGLNPLIWSVTDPASTSVEPIQAHLPENIRGEVLEIKAQKQYVLVITENGQHLLRISMKEAVSLVHASSGWRVHRSRWLHKSRVRALIYKQGNPQIVDEDGNEIPISRHIVPSLREYLNR